MRFTNDLRDELSKLDATLQEFRALSDDISSDTGAGAMWRDLEDHRAQLLRELAKLSAGELTVVFDGAAVTDHGADVEALVQTLGEFQRSVASIGQALDSDATTRGAIPVDLRTTTALRLVDVAPGSFVASLTGPVLDGEQLVLGPGGVAERPLFERSIDRLLDILVAAEHDDYEQLVLEAVAELGTRVTAHIDLLAKAIAMNDAPTDFIWRPPDAPERHVRFDREPAERLRGVVKELDSSEETLQVSGRLVGADVVRKSFAIMVDDGEDTIISGKVAATISDRVVEDYFNHPCRATVRAVTTVNTATGRKVTRYTLEEFSGPLDA